MQKPSLWFLPVSNTTPHIYTTPPLFKVALLLCFLAVDWPLQGQHKLPSEGVFLILLTSLPFFYRETTGSLDSTLRLPQQSSRLCLNKHPSFSTFASLAMTSFNCDASIFCADLWFPVCWIFLPYEITLFSSTLSPFCNIVSLFPFVSHWLHIKINHKKDQVQ